MSRTLILGGARSGKSAYAERLAAASGKEAVYIATGHAGDAEMAERIARHRADRPAHWRTVEEPLALADALRQWRAPERVVLVDCLTLWLSNLLFSDGTQYPDIGRIDLPPRFHLERAALLQELAGQQGDVLLVSNEVGLGIVPFGAVSRAFADEAGRLNQALAALCDRAVFVAAGLPLQLKGSAC
ncbi:bifunctional adenosylcobinamide kinase/adenosylcobinamide-phosphate guanylyltransferase [Massilia endophytica]|uniref:bifunctional adenosylcobinamide kinase/adenosylcobinamide-phosphate guanylyltransferase n=1 Tax=Massilia endophytica TaxID=2899220 RepID=UPI001E58EEBE|nr:bifunctional adenosylcobinamide kinase/adenosylcobinamide-phosphate guanylyltransferase [Massilia endophytica]UGQ47719.1 bifunctional adenosylcobinamide kinase/adenosylcobinamide-phosphate guanylyltransferase [Massilia endophytica]